MKVRRNLRTPHEPFDLQIEDRLLYTLQNCTSIATDPKYSIKDRIEAERLKVDVSPDLLKLASEGPMMAQIKLYKDRQINVDGRMLGSG